MKKTSFALDFYKNNIFSLDDIDKFREKVIEAERVYQYFKEDHVNENYLRKYILRSYKMNKDLTFIDRINYVRGLAYSDDYIDFNDIVELEEHITKSEYPMEKKSIWGYSEYYSDYNNDNLLDLAKDEDEIDSNETYMNIKSEEMNNTINGVLESLGINQKDVMIEYYSIDEEEDPVNDFVTLDEKIDLFKEKYEEYVNLIINKKIIDNVIVREDIPMIVKGMNDWFFLMIGFIDDMNRINNRKLKYLDENIGKFI